MRAGFAVVSYSMAGAIKGELSAATDRQIRDASVEFAKSREGLLDAQAAIEYVTQRFPEIDTNRLYTAGHSSAGTHSLYLAQVEPRIKAVVAYAPCVDMRKRFGDVMGDLRSLLPHIDKMLAQCDPAKLGEPRCPTLIFHTDDDSVTPVDESRAFAQRYPSKVMLDNTGRGDHYDAMIEYGIPSGIRFLKRHAKQG